MKIDVSGIDPYFELEDGTRVDSRFDIDGYEGYVTYHHGFPCTFVQYIDSFNYHAKNWYERLLLNCFPRLQRKWNRTKGRTFKPICEFNNGFFAMSDVIVAMVKSGDYTLEQSIWICSTSCERCMNVLSMKYTGANGYEEYSEEWKKCNTVCDFCREEE